MRDARVLPWVIACVLLAGGARRALSQAPRYADRVRGIEALSAVRTRASARLAAYDDSVQAATARLDTARVGPFTLRASSSALSLARVSLAAALDSLAPAFGSALGRLAGFSAVVQLEFAPSGRGTDMDSSLAVSMLDAAGRGRGETQVAVAAAPLSAAFRSLAANAVLGSAAPVFMDWLRGGAPMAPLSEEQWRNVRLGLISSPAAVGRRCFAGNTEDCAVALGLRAPADTVTEWFDAGDRRALVAHDSARARALDPEWTRECLAGSDATCIDILRRGPWPFPLPAPPIARAALTRHGVEMGGGRALERLATAAGTPGEHIAAAAGVPLTQVIADWQAHVRDLRAPSRDLSWEITWVALGWVLGLGFLSTRSSRWR